MISLTYRSRLRPAISASSRISSPLTAFRGNPAFPTPVLKVLKNLTFGIHLPKNPNRSDSVCRAFPVRRDDFGPVFPHLSDHTRPKRLPKSLTSHPKGQFAELATTPIHISRISSPFLIDEPCLRRRRQPNFRRNPTLLPQTLTLRPRMPRIKAKMTPLPRKVSPSVRVFSRLDSPIGCVSPK